VKRSSLALLNLGPRSSDRTKWNSASCESGTEDISAPSACSNTARNPNPICGVEGAVPRGLRGDYPFGYSRCPGQTNSKHRRFPLRSRISLVWTGGPPLRVAVVLREQWDARDVPNHTRRATPDPASPTNCV